MELIDRAISLHQMGKLDDAEAIYRKILDVDKNHFDALHMLGIIHAQRKSIEVAEEYLRRALTIDKTVAPCLQNYGLVCAQLNRFDDAVKYFSSAIALAPSSAILYVNLGDALFALKRFHDALPAYEKALAINPNLAPAHVGFGNVFNNLKIHDKAAVAYAAALRIDPQYPFVKGHLLYQKLMACDWTKLSELIVEIENDVLSGRLSAHPFSWQAATESLQNLKICAELYNRQEYPARVENVARKSPVDHGKIRIGYVSGEFRDQATAHLIVGLLELHDKTRFDVFCIDNGLDDQSDVRKRINRSVNGIINIRNVSDGSAAALIAENEIDILVNLNGYFGDERTRVFARRPAPIQVNYLGFPGTLGASYIDYIVADKIVIPPHHVEFYTEKVVHLPNSYQANDNRREVAPRDFSRAECGLPENGFVFCCFNNNYKILPKTFSAWMQILKTVEGSVLWLIEDNATAASNLKKEAIAQGVNSDRLVFAKRMPLAEHLARHRVADLFLDSLPYNAHTTASDSLWAGLPILTLAGKTFPGKVAASLLNAVGLQELVTTNREAYVAAAIDLATHPEKLAAIKQRLAENRLVKPLFDTKLFTGHLESAYTRMYERFRRGLPPDHIVIQN